jgi:hypothetical protein
VAIFKIEQNIFQTFKHRRGPRPIATALRLIDKHVNPIGLTCLKTPNAKHLEKVPRPDRDRSCAGTDLPIWYYNP